MSEQSRKLNIIVNLDTGRVESQAKQAKESIAEIGNETAKQGSRMADVFKGVGGTIAATFALGRIKSFISEIINVRSEIQSLEVSFTTLLGSETKAAELFGQIRQFATSTPMQLNDLAQGAQTMLGFNIELEKVMPMLKSIGDISMGNREKFNSLTLAFSQMSATGKLMGQDLLQMINAGFNPLTEISAKTGKAISTLKEEMSAGSISAKMVEDAFKSATAEGGKFHGMLEQQSKTLRGSLSNLQGAFNDMLNDFGKSSEGIIAGGVNAAYEMVKNYRETAEALLALIATVGVYKAALITETAMQAAAVDTAMARIGAIGQVNAAEATGIELEVQKAIAAGSVTKAQGEEIIATYALAKARVADLKQLAVHAQAELQQAIATERAAAAQVRAAEETVIAANMKYEAALRSGNAQKIETAELELGTAQAELNTASRIQNTAQVNIATASKKASIASTTAETAANELNTVSLTTQSKATTFLTLAKTQLIGVVRKLWATMTVHPLALLLAAVTALGYGIYKLCTYQTDAEKATKKMNEAHAQAQGAFMEEERQIKKLFDALKNAKEGTEAYKKAKEDIWSKYGNYLKALGDENTALKDQAAAYALVAKKAREAAMAKAKEAFLSSDDAKKLSENLGKTYLEAYKLIEKKYGSAYAQRNKDGIRRIVSGDANVNPKLLEAFNEQTYTITGADYQGNPTWGYVQTNKLQNLIQKGRRQVKEIDDLNEAAEIMFGSAEDPGKAEPEEPAKNYATEVKTAQKRLSEARAKYNRLKKSKTSTVAEVEEAKKEYEAAKEAYDTLSSSKADGSKGSQKPPEKIAAERVAAMQKEASLSADQLRERNRAILEYETQLEQMRIDIMEDGAAKRLRQRELDNAKELDALYRQMDDEIKAEVERQKAIFDAQEVRNAVGKKNYAKKTFDAGDILTTQWATDSNIGEEFNSGNVKIEDINAIFARYDVLAKLLAERQRKAEDEQREEALLAMQEYLREYGTMEEKKTAIAAIYAAKRAKAATDAERMTLIQEERKALNDVEFDDFITNRAALAFGEIENLTTGTISELIRELEKYRSKVTATFDPEKIEKYNEALARLKRAQTMSEGGIFKQFLTPDFFKERNAAQQEIIAAEQTHNDLLEAKAQKEREVADRIQRIIDKVKELTNGETTLTKDQVLDGNTVQEIIGQLGNNGNKQGATDLTNLINGLGTARTELGNVTTASNTAGQSLGQLKEAFASKFSGKNGALAMVDTIVHGINDMVQGVKETVDELASTADALGADISVGSGWDKAKTVMEGFANASAGATQAWDSLKSGNIGGVIAGVTKSFTSWIKMFSSLHDASRERTIQRLQKQIEELDRINKRLDRRRDKEYSKQKRDTYEEEIRNLERQRRLIQEQIAAEQDKKDTDNDRIQEWRDQIEEIENTIEDYKDAANDAILGEDIASSIDNFADALCDSWGRAADRAKATKDFVKTLLKQMVMEAMKTDLTTPIKKLREMMAKALDDDIITEAEEQELVEFAQQLGQEMERKYKWADGIVKDNTASQQGSSGDSFATASQDSIDELSGRAAAIHTSGEMRRELLLGIGFDTQAIRAQLAASHENAAEIRELSLLAVGHLETIARNTGELKEMNERLDQIERNTRRI